MFEVIEGDRSANYANSTPDAAWPSFVICLPSDKYFVLDIDHGKSVDEAWLAERGYYPKTADAYVLTDSGAQFVWCQPKLPAHEQEDWLQAQDDDYAELAGDSWHMRLLSKRVPMLRRAMVPLTKLGAELAEEWNRAATKAMEDKAKEK